MATNYKDTLNLPKTDFPMKAGLTGREPERLALWEEEGLYAKIQAARKDAELFVLHDGPPFANGDVHMGTALNKTLKDIIVKSKTMAGFRAPFVPGWDCHGLPIEFKVVQESRGLEPLEIREKSEAYARKYVDIQRGQYKRLGVLGDWEHPYLTLDPGYEAEIIRAFGKFVAKELVYQSKKPVYWSTGAQTALAEAEVEYADRTDPAIYVKFPLVTGPLAGKASMVIWTTTPWTLPANVAIAVSPKQEYVLGEFPGSAGAPPAVVRAPADDSPRETTALPFCSKVSGGAPATAGEAPALPLIVARALLESFQRATGLVLQKELGVFTGEQLTGSEAQHPFLDRTSKVITAGFVTMETGTGQVHIAPGHGADDYIAGLQNGLPVLSPVDDNGKFTDEVGVPEWEGLYVFKANPLIVDHLAVGGHLLGREDYTHSYPHCWRSKTPIVFRAVEQFFIRIDAFREQALAEIDKVKWIPPWGRNRIHGTVESRPDWCISRQRTWGVPLPVFYTAEGEVILDPALIGRVADLVAEHGTNIWFALDDAAMAEKLGLPAGTTRRTDTLDVWIDSGISHEAVVRKHPELRFPADLYIEATDQHRGWFQSSLMTSVAMNGVAPYRAVLTHGFVVDVDGKKISKSSSYQKPMDAMHFVNKHGADIVRLWVSSVNYTDDVPFSEEQFTRLSDTYRRIRNTLRILLANLSDYDGTEPADLPLIDRWILARLQETIATCREAYESYEFHRVYHALNQFCAVDLSSLYIDITKDRLYCDRPDSPRRRASQFAMRRVFDALCRLLAPILAYTADEAWRFAGNTDSVHLELFPEVKQSAPDKDALDSMAKCLGIRSELGQEIEKVRAEKKIGKALEAEVELEVTDESFFTSLNEIIPELEEILIVGELKLRLGDANRFSITLTDRPKCARCWRHRESVGQQPAHPELCDRCAEAVAN